MTIFETTVLIILIVATLWLAVKAVKEKIEWNRHRDWVLYDYDWRDERDEEPQPQSQEEKQNAKTRMELYLEYFERKLRK